jgi:hypothetical protein
MYIGGITVGKTLTSIAEPLGIRAVVQALVLLPRLA